MSGHSKWATIKRKKGALDAKRGAQFTKVSREITQAARQGGGNPDMNARLRAAIIAGKAINMPAATLERAIKKGTGDLEGAAYEEISYEGYGPGGVAIYVEAMTDNRNRTFPEIRKIFEKAGGQLGSSNSVAYLFEKKGEIVVDQGTTTEEKLMEVALEAGADDIEDQGGSWAIACTPSAFHQVVKALQEAQVPTASAEIAMVASTSIHVEGSTAGQVLRLVEALEDHDDVQKVWANFDIDDETLAASA